MATTIKSHAKLLLNSLSCYLTKPRQGKIMRRDIEKGLSMEVAYESGMVCMPHSTSFPIQWLHLLLSHFRALEKPCHLFLSLVYILLDTKPP